MVFTGEYSGIVMIVQNDSICMLSHPQADDVRALLQDAMPPPSMPPTTTKASAGSLLTPSSSGNR